MQKKAFHKNRPTENFYRSSYRKVFMMIKFYGFWFHFFFANNPIPDLDKFNGRLLAEFSVLSFSLTRQTILTSNSLERIKIVFFGRKNGTFSVEVEQPLWISLWISHGFSVDFPTSGSQFPTRNWTGLIGISLNVRATVLFIRWIGR